MLDMRTIYNNIIPFKGYAGINLFGILFVRKRVKVSNRMLNHERIHTAQMKEMVYVFFYIWYLIEWLVRLCGHGNAYRRISFEQEAYDNELNPDYLNTRKHFNWFKYIC